MDFKTPTSLSQQTLSRTAVSIWLKRGSSSKRGWESRRWAHLMPNIERGFRHWASKGNCATLGYITPWRKLSNFQKVRNVQAFFYHSLINQNCSVEQTKFNKIEAEKKFILSLCCLFKLLLCWWFLLQSLDEISGHMSHNISSHPWIKQTNSKNPPPVVTKIALSLLIIKMSLSSVKAFPLPCSGGGGKPAVGEGPKCFCHTSSPYTAPPTPRLLGLWLLTPQVGPRGNRRQETLHSLM